MELRDELNKQTPYIEDIELTNDAQTYTLSDEVDNKVRPTPELLEALKLQLQFANRPDLAIAYIQLLQKQVEALMLKNAAQQVAIDKLTLENQKLTLFAAIDKATSAQREIISSPISVTRIEPNDNNRSVEIGREIPVKFNK